MAKVILYSSDHCPYCVNAKSLLEQKNIAFTELRVDTDPQLREEMITKSGRRTVPQIFINDPPIGGCDDLYALNRSGELDKLLAYETPRK